MKKPLFLLASALLVGPLSECQAQQWVRPQVESEPTVVYTDPVLQKSYHTSLDRMTQELLSRDFILADVNFNQERRFTNFSGDISGRFIEVCSAASLSQRPWPETLPEVLAEVIKYQKADGHFGKEVDWSAPVDFDPGSDQTLMMPILWGNGRLLLGLCEAAGKFGDPAVLAAAKKLGDFYVQTVQARFCDSKRMDEYQSKAQYAAAYVTCVYEGMEGLVQLYRLTQEKRYLNCALAMADFHEDFDTLPTGHSHGSLSQSGALVMIFEETGQTKYLERAVNRWEEAVYGGYVNPCGGVFEKFVPTGYAMDEGCSEADWLRLNLILWANTGKTRYLDMAERLLWNAFMANQWSNGGFGHRSLASDEVGAYAFTKPVAESYWCCTYHGALALHKLRSYLAVGSEEGIYINFPVAFEGTVEFKGQKWYVKTSVQDLESTDPKESLHCRQLRVEVSGPDIHPPKIIVRTPQWAGDCKTSFTFADSMTLDGKLPRFYSEPANSEGLRQQIFAVESFPKTKKFVAEFSWPMPVYLEPRLFSKETVDSKVGSGFALTSAPSKEGVQRFEKSVLRYGPYVLMNPNSGEVETLSLKKILGGENSFELEGLAGKAAPYIELPNQPDSHAFLFNVEVTP